eukprot:767352-Hanusia_phi.AAC.1
MMNDRILRITLSSSHIGYGHGFNQHGDLRRRHCYRTVRVDELRLGSAHCQASEGLMPDKAPASEWAPGLRQRGLAAELGGCVKNLSTLNPIARSFPAPPRSAQVRSPLLEDTTRSLACHDA